MDLTDTAGTFTRTEQGVLLAALGSPTETAFALRVLIAHIYHRSRHVDKLFEFLLICVGEDTVSAVALLLLSLAIDVHRLGCVTDLLHGELDTADFQNITLLNLIVDFFVVDLQATHDQIHRFLLFAVLLVIRKVICMELIRGALQVKCAVVVIDDFEHSHIFRRPLCSIELLLKAAFTVELGQHKVVSRPHDHGLVARF